MLLRILLDLLSGSLQEGQSSWRNRSEAQGAVLDMHQPGAQSGLRIPCPSCRARQTAEIALPDLGRATRWALAQRPREHTPARAGTPSHRVVPSMRLKGALLAKELDDPPSLYPLTPQRFPREERERSLA